MKKIVFLVLIILSLTVFTGCKNSDQSKIWGDYVFDKTIYLSALSSYNPEYSENQMDSMKYTIKDDVFEISSSDSDYKVSQPVYRKEKIDGNFIQVLGENKTISISDYTDKFRYSIYDADNKKINYYLYLMDGELWISSYSNGNDKDIIMYIYKLK